MISRSSRGSIVAGVAALLLAAAAPASAQYYGGGGGGYGGGGGGYGGPPPGGGYGGPPPGGGYDRPPPRQGYGGGGAGGSFRQSCNNIRQNGSYVTADCISRRGEYRQASIDLQDCGGRSRLGNNNGRLFCE